MYRCIASRIGLVTKRIDIAAGVMDQDYTGKIQVLLVNNSDITFKVNIGDCIAQLIIEWIATVKFKTVKSLMDTECGEKEFGSTGV